MAFVPYKYTLLDRLRKLPVEEYEIALKWLPLQCNVAKSTFRSWIYIKNDNPKDIPATALLTLSRFFQCDAHELLSTPLEKKAVVIKWTEYKSQFLTKCSERYKQAKLF